MKNNENITKLGMERLMADGDYRRGDFHQAMLNVAYNDWQEHDNAMPMHAVERDTKNEVFVGTKAQLDEWWNSERDSGRGIEWLRGLKTEYVNKDEGWSYGDMLDNAREKYGELFFAMILAGKYNQQVCNGGHVQYFDNGYGDRDGGGFGGDHNPKLPLHDELIAAVKNTIVPLARTGHEGETIAAALDVMDDLEIRIDRCRTMQCDCEDCGGTGREDDGGSCGSCGGSGTSEEDNEDYGQVENLDELGKLDDRWYAIDEEFVLACNDIVMRECAKADPGVGLITIAAGQAEEWIERCKADGTCVMPLKPQGVGPRGDECYRLIAEDNIRYGYLELANIGYMRNVPSEVKKQLRETIKRMATGAKLNYWHDIADRFDMATDDGIRDDVREAYDEVLEQEVNAGRLKELHEDEDDDEITTGYEKTEPEK